MLGCKRLASTDRPEPKLVKNDTVSIYEATIFRMKSAQPASIPALSAQKDATVDQSTCSCRPDPSASDGASNGPRTYTSSGLDGKIVRVQLGSTSGNNAVSKVDNNKNCFHCRRKTCNKCCRNCSRCNEDFCSVCSMLDFSERDDRAFCLDCYSHIQ